MQNPLTCFLSFTAFNIFSKTYEYILTLKLLNFSAVALANLSNSAIRGFLS